MQFYLDDPELGRIIVKVRHGSHTISARWHDDQLHVNVPNGTPAAMLRQFIDTHRSNIVKHRRPAVSFHEGQVIECFHCTVTLGVQSVKPGHIMLKHDGESNIIVSLPAGTDFDSALAKQNLSRALQQVMAKEAVKRLIPYAMQLAQRLGVSVKGFEIGRGKQKLGHCTSKGIIQLSRNVMFLTPELVDLIICHELAHLQHMNHSAAFHALCNTYLGGREKELEAKLKRFQWPILQ